MDSNPQMFAKRETWTVDQVLYAPTKSPQFSTDLENTKTIDEIVSVLQKYKVRFARRSSKLDTALVPPSMYKQITNLPAEQPFVVPVGDKAIASFVVSREANPLTGDQAKPIAVAAIRKSATQKSLEDLLKSLKSSAKIEYQPGFAPKKS
jgi:hypothetical protein